MYRRYPYTNFHDINLDWIISRIHEIEKEYIEIGGKIDGLYDYVKQALIDNVDQTVKDIIQEMIDDGTLEEVIMEAFNNLDERVTKLEDNIELIFPSYNTTGYGEAVDTNGCCTILKTKNKALMVDTFLGAKNFIGVKKSLEYHNIDKLDYVIITHYHADHYGNLNLLINDINCDDATFIIPRPVINNPNISEDTQNRYNEVLSMLQNRNVLIADNNILDIDGAIVKLFNSSLDDFAYMDATGTNVYNNYSIVVDIQYKKSKVLLLSDIYKEAQQRLIDAKYIVSDYDIIQDAHHGLSTAYIPFANQVSPNNVVVQTTIRMSDNIINNYSRNMLNSLWNTMTDNIIYTGYNDEETSYIIGDTVKLTSKSFTLPNSAQNVNLEITVDSSKDTLRRDGSIKYPFHSVGEACHFLNNKLRQNCTINVINCDNVKTYIYGLNGRVVINFNNNEIPLLQIEDCYGDIIIQNAKIKRVNNARCMNIFRASLIQLQNCEFDGNNIATELFRCDASSMYISSKLTVRNVNVGTLVSLYNSNLACNILNPETNIVIDNASSTNFMTGVGSRVCMVSSNATSLLQTFGNIATSAAKVMNIFSSSLN